MLYFVVAEMVHESARHTVLSLLYFCTVQNVELYRNQDSKPEPTATIQT